MNRFVFLLGFLLMALMTVTLQAQKIIPLWQNNMPNSKGIVLKDSVVRELWGIERSGFFNGREKWAKGFENQRV